MMAEAAHTEEEKKFNPTSAVEEVGPCKLKLKIEVSAARVKEEIEEHYRELNETMALPGFRKGHAPRGLLERKYGKALLDDVKGEILGHSFEEVRDEKKLEPVGEPEIDVGKLAVEEGKPFAYEVVIEVRPKFDVKNYTGLKVTRKAFAVEDKEVEAVLRNFQESRAELVPAEDALAKEHDQLIADFTLQVDGKDVDAAENQALFLNAEISFYGLQLPEFHKAVEGRKVGDSLDYAVKLPADFAEKKHAGKDAVIKTLVKSVKRKKLPAIDAEFAKSFDMDSVEEFTEHVKKRIAREKEAQVRAAMSEELVGRIVDANDFPMPEGLVAAGAEEAMRRMQVNLTMRGVPEAEIAKVVEEEKGASKDEMARSLRAHFILEDIAKTEKIFVTEDQVEERIAQIAAQYGKWPHEMKEYLEAQGLAPQLRRTMREEQVREFLLSKAVIEEAKPEEKK